jgi:hypothetical protein
MRNLDWTACTYMAIGGFFGFRAGRLPAGWTAASYTAALVVVFAGVQAVGLRLARAMGARAGGAS